MLYTGKPEDGVADKKHLPSRILIFSINCLHVCSSYVQTYLYIMHITLHYMYIIPQYTHGEAPNQ